MARQWLWPTALVYSWWRCIRRHRLVSLVCVAVMTTAVTSTVLFRATLPTYSLNVVLEQHVLPYWNASYWKASRLSHWISPYVKFRQRPYENSWSCEYSDLVDLRVIVLACNRPDALSMLLSSLDNLVLDGATASLEIWIDRNKNGTVHNATSHVAHSFAWSRGVTRVHVWPRHVGIYGQWIDTWCPAVTDEDGRSGEMALILEEDLVVSPYAWRWLRAVRRAYGNRTDLAGYSLQSENVYCAAADKKRQALSVPKKHTTYAYRVLGTWGFAPHLLRWAEFRTWFHDMRDNKTHVATNRTFKPYVDKIKMTQWYKSLEKVHKEDSMWSMWFIYFAHGRNLYTLYNNINQFVNNGTNYLAFHNVKFGGLHFKRTLNVSVKTLTIETNKKVLRHWNEEFGTFTSNIYKFEFNGSRTTF